MKSKKYLPTIFAIIIVIGIVYIGILATNNNQKIDNTVDLIEVFKATDFTADRDKFFDALKATDWNIIIKSNDSSALEILEKLYSIEFQSDREIESILSAYKGLDGAYAELYSAIVSKIYLNDELNTAKILSQLPESNIIEVIKFIKYGCSYENSEKAFKDSLNILKSNELTEKERSVIMKIVN